MSKTKKNELDENMFEDLGGDEGLDTPSDFDTSPNMDDYSDQVSSPPPTNTDLYGDNEVDSDNSRWELDPDDVFNRIEHLLRSERISKDGSKWVKVPGVSRIINERGIFEIMRDLNLYINKNTVLANIDEKMMNKIMRNISITLVIRLKNQYKQFEIEKYNLSYIQRTVENEIYLFLTRALGGMERKIRRDKYRMTESVNNQGGGFGFPNLFNRNNNRGKGGLNL